MDAKVTEYFEMIPESRKPLLASLHTMILEAFPDITVDMKYRMPTYALGEGWVSIANQKNYVSLYTCSAHHLEAFKEKHPEIKTGKGCINFLEKDTLPLEDLKQVVEHAILHPKDGAC